MIKIGDFAKICNVSTQTLRYYDTEGILKADVIDQSSGYRFYSPDAVEKYKQILFYKDLGFTLEDIKLLQSSSDDAVRKKLKERKSALEGDVRFLKLQIQKIEDAFKSDKARVSLPDVFRLPFVDDPDVLGKWELCGELLDEANLTSVVPIDSARAFHKELSFLPGGAFVWNYCWTKGVVYWMPSKYNFAIPNEYRIINQEDERYMILEFMSDACIENGVDVTILLYRQIDNLSYTDRQIRPHVDKTDLPLVEDEAVLGDWRVVDFVPEVDAFCPDVQYTKDIGGYIVAMHFHQRGICTRMINARSGLKPWTLRYTKGTLLNDAEMVAEAYQIKRINSRDFLFVQHKSGDYTYGGRTPYWYVFERKEN